MNDASDESKARNEARCIDCGSLPPPTDPDNTLISRHGWRLTRAVDGDGRKRMEWRCPECWKEYRSKHSV